MPPSPSETQNIVSAVRNKNEEHPDLNRTSFLFDPDLPSGQVLPRRSLESTASEPPAGFSIARRGRKANSEDTEFKTRNQADRSQNNVNWELDGSSNGNRKSLIYKPLCIYSHIPISLLIQIEPHLILVCERVIFLLSCEIGLLRRGSWELTDS